MLSVSFMPLKVIHIFINKVRESSLATKVKDEVSLQLHLKPKVMIVWNWSNLVIKYLSVSV